MWCLPLVEVVHFTPRPPNPQTERAPFTRVHPEECFFHHHAEIRRIILPRKSNLRYKRAENDLLRGTVFYKQPHLGTQEHIYCRATH